MVLGVTVIVSMLAGCETTRGYAESSRIPQSQPKYTQPKQNDVVPDLVVRKPSQKPQTERVFSRKEKRTDSLSKAVASDDVRWLKAIVEFNALEASDLYLNSEPLLHTAARLHSYKILRFLLEQGADPKVKNIFGENLFQLAELDSTIKTIIEGMK